MVGFRVPDYAGKLNVPGYHFHFLTADHHAGGHVLACRIQSGKVEIDHTTRFLMILPQHGAFAETDIAQPRNEELGTVEKASHDGLPWPSTIMLQAADQLRVGKSMQCHGCVLHGHEGKCSDCGC